MVTEPVITVHERIYRALRQRVMFGEIKPGCSFTIRGLANEFKVSMTPVRESIRRLAAEGAFSMSQSGRIMTIGLSTDRIEELVSLRNMLEPELAIRALPRVHTVLINRLSSINNLIEEMIVKENSTGYIQKNIEFHKTLYLRAQAPAMLAFLETIWLQSGPTMRYIYDKKIRYQTTYNHRLLLSALRSGSKTDIISSLQADVTSCLGMLLD